MPDSPDLHVVTFITRSGRRCYFAVRGETEPDGTTGPVRLPPHIRAQLYAIGARVAWWYIGPMGLQVPGEASDSSAPVTTAEQKDLGRLVFLDSAPPPPPV